MKAYLSIYPAYGRRYPNATAAKQDLLDGKDFSASRQGGPYLSKRDFLKDIPELKHFNGVIIHQVIPMIYILVHRKDIV